MQYLVLHGFISYGVWYRKGDVVDEAKIRSPRLKLSEGKIVATDLKTAVFSSSQASIVETEEPAIDAPIEGNYILRFKK